MARTRRDRGPTYASLLDREHQVFVGRSRPHHIGLRRVWLGVPRVALHHALGLGAYDHHVSQLRRENGGAWSALTPLRSTSGHLFSGECTTAVNDASICCWCYVTIRPSAPARSACVGLIRLPRSSKRRPVRGAAEPLSRSCRATSVGPRCLRRRRI